MVILALATSLPMEGTPVNWMTVISSCFGGQDHQTSQVSAGLERAVANRESLGFVGSL